jgi:hypothetical protein
VDTVAIGDSDFSPLVNKLRENDETLDTETAAGNPPPCSPAKSNSA